MMPMPRPCTCADAKLLAGKRAEVVAADAMDAAQLRSAFEGAYGVFFVTVPYVIFAGKEFEQGAAGWTLWHAA